MGAKWFVDYIPIGNVEYVLLVVLSMYQVGMLSVFTCEMLSMYRVEMLHLYVFHLPAGFMCLKLCLSHITSPLTGVFLLPHLFVSVFC